MSDDELVPVKRAAAICGVSVGTMRVWANTGKVPYIKINSRGDRRFSVAALRATLGIAGAELSSVSR